jgi:protein TonB
VIATDAMVEDDVTIAPTTFEENPVEELPPPPEEVVESDATTPTFTPFTVAPRITNGTELARVMQSEYPVSLKNAGIGGVVVVWFYIDETGAVRDTRVHQSSGYPQLDEAALSVAERAEFSPALNGDRNVPVWIQFPIDFRVR